MPTDSTSVTTINRLPARTQVSIFQGSPWDGVNVRLLDPDGVPDDPQPTLTADVRTATYPEGGIVVASCDISSPDEDGWQLVSLPAATTLDFTSRQYFCDIRASFDVDEDDEPVPGPVLMRLTMIVEGLITGVEPTPPDPPEE